MFRSFAAVAVAMGLSGAALAYQQAAAPQPVTTAAEAQAPEWDVANPPMQVREVAIDVREGTWMNLDVSPDGQTIAFDLLGDIYTMPISGGEATRIAEGLPFEMQPRFSPDGSRIAFTSDRGGGNNIWIMNVDGSDKRQVTKEDFRLLNNPTWSKDGRFIAARKHFTTGRSLGTGEIWLYHVSGGTGVALVERPNEQHQKELGEPMFDAEGTGIYFSRNITPGPIFEYAEDSNTDLYNIERYDLATGERETIVSGPGGAVRPTPSPDGKYLAFVGRERADSKLFVRDIETGEEWKVYDNLDQDMQEGWAVQGVYPNMDWLPDSRTLIFWAGGQIQRIDVTERGSEPAVIPFHVADTRKLIDPVRPQVEVAPATFQTEMPRFAGISPDGRTIVFSSLGKLYTVPAAGGEPERLTSDDGEAFELFPSWSADGERIVYVRWTDAGLGEIRTIGRSGGAGETVTETPGHYRRPRFSPDGETIVFEKSDGGYLTSDRYSGGEGVYKVAAEGGEPERLTSEGYAPHFGASSDRVFMTRSGEGKRELISVSLQGSDERVHASGELVTGFSVSPSGNYLALHEDYNAFVMPFYAGGETFTVGSAAEALPAKRVSAAAATYIGWQDDDTLSWTMGPVLYRTDVASAIGNEAFTAPTSGVSLSMPVEADVPEGSVVLTGARIVTMSAEDGGVIENGTIVIDGNRIAAIGPAGSVEVPAGAEVVDVTGRTIIPGLIDAHAHGPQGVDDIIPQQNWEAIAHLALGVTTVHDPSNAASEIFPAAEMQRAGLILAPRIFSTGEIVYGAKAPDVYAVIDDIEDARDHVRRLKAQGAHSIKNYNQPRREQRQQIIKAAHEENIAVVAEGGSLFGMDIGHIADGNTTVEHNFPQEKLYEDVLSYFGQSNVGYTPTLVVTFGGLGGDPYWRMTTNVWEHPILSQHAPPGILQANSVRRLKAPEEDFYDNRSAANAAALAERGVLVSIGGHGQEEGLAAHWDLWSFVRGGMTPLEALQAGTIAPARSLGFDRDIGSLEAGKLADLVILEQNPLEDIGNSDSVVQVMLGGRLYDAATMNEVTTGDFKLDPYWWEQ